MATLANPVVNATKLLYLAPIAGLAAAILNVILYFVGTSTGAIPTDFIIPNAGQPLTVVPVIMASIVPALIAGLVLAILARFTKKPLTIFNVLSVVLLVLSFWSPFTVPGMPLGMIIILELMHVVVAGAVMLVFNRYARE